MAETMKFITKTIIYLGAQAFIFNVLFPLLFLTWEAQEKYIIAETETTNEMP